MRSVLFVEDEPLILQGLQRMLRPRRREWDMRFQEGGVAALAAMAERPADLVVSDLRMPGMDGAELMAEVARRHPGTIRLILTGHADREMVLRCLGNTHRILSKPFEPGRLGEVVDEAFSAVRRLRELGWCDRARLPSRIPVPMPALERVRRAVGPDGPDPGAVACCVESDPSLTFGILHAANSGILLEGLPIRTVRAAVSRLGTELLRRIVVDPAILEPAPPDDSDRLGASAAHWRCVARVAGRIALSSGSDGEAVDAIRAAVLILGVGTVLGRLPEPVPVPGCGGPIGRLFGLPAELSPVVDATAGAVVLQLPTGPGDAAATAAALVEHVAGKDPSSREGWDPAWCRIAAEELRKERSHEEDPVCR